MNKANSTSYQIGRQRDVINKKTHTGYDPSRQPPYTYSKSEGSFQSIFAMWEWVCKLYREGNKALAATRISIVYFVQVIVRRRSLNKTFCIENLVYILSIQSTALLAMISASKFKVKQPIVFLVPESFELIAKSFDIINCDCQEGNNCRLLTACFNTSQDVSYHKILRDSVKLLIYILEILSGTYKENYKPLMAAVNHGTDTEAIHCLVLTLTVLGNLVLHDLIHSELCHSIYNKILSAFQSTLKSKLIIRTMPETFYQLASSKNTKELFEGVISRLLQSVGLRLMSLQTVINLGKPRIVIKPFLSRRIPRVDFKWPPYQMPPQLLPKKEPPSATQDTSGAETEANQQEESLLRSTAETEITPEDILAEDDNQLSDRQTPEGETSIGDEDDKRDGAQEDQSDNSTDIESGDEEESEDEDVRKELSAAAVAEVKLEKAPEPDLKLEREKNEFLNETHCIICRIEVEEAKDHFESEKHLHQKKRYVAYQSALYTYEFTQKHLVEIIDDCQSMEHTEYEIEKAAMHAEQLIKSNDEEIAKQRQEFNWENRIEKLKELRDQTGKVIKELDIKLQQAKQRVEESQEAELSEEEKSEDEEKN